MKKLLAKAGLILFFSLAVVTCIFIFTTGPTWIEVSVATVEAKIKQAKWLTAEKNWSSTIVYLGNLLGRETMTLSPNVTSTISQEQGLFRFDAKEFKKNYGATAFRDAQLAHAKGTRLIPFVRGWGSLPYPPVRNLSEAADPNTESAHGAILESPYFKPELHVELDELTHSELTKNNIIKLQQNSNSISSVRSVIQDAKRFIFIQALSVNCDGTTQEIMDELLNKAKNGVDVRLIVNQTFALLERACIQKLEAGGVKVLKSKTHSSYFVNDKSQLLIGSQSIARMFYQSDGFNFLDRDTMVYIEGPVATDAVRDFLGTWLSTSSEDSHEILSYIPEVKKLRQQELKTKVRGQSQYSDWMKNPNNKLCRFLSQRPDDREQGIEEMIKFGIGKAKKNIRFSGVKIDPIDGANSDNPALEILRSLQRASRGGISVDYIGNGPDGGNGEATMVLNEYIEENMKSHNSIGVKFWGAIKGWDSKRTTAANMESYRSLVKNSNIQPWMYFNFLHYKVWTFDKYGVLIGSANTTGDSFNKFTEAGVFCVDQALAAQMDLDLRLDMVNAMPFFAGDQK